MNEPPTANLLVDYYEAFLKDQDLDAFRQKVSARYTEGTLGRLLQAEMAETRRAAVLALGLTGTFGLNETIAQRLADDDAVVRALAQKALWAIWFRADTPENNAALEETSDLIERGRHREADDRATTLIGKAPKFAEAYNQRAIARFFLGRFGESAEDCRRVVELNPVHIGALSGLGQCYLRMGERRKAIETFQRVLKLQPHNDLLRDMLNDLEAGDV